MINRGRLFDLLSELIAIDSQNPPGDERRIAQFVAAYLRKAGLKPELVELVPKRANVLCRIKGAAGKKGRTRELLVTPHLDTVPAGKSWHHAPLRATKKGGRIYGLGATDCKGNLACCLESICSLCEDRARLGYDLLFCATADEESGSRAGLEPLIAKKVVKPDAAVVLDCEDFEIIVAQKGLLHAKLRLTGKRAHGAYPWQGVNAVEAAARIIAAVSRQKFSYRRNAWLHPPTVNTGTIRGGDKVNIVPDWCEAEFDFRFLPGMDHKTLVAGLKRQAARFSKSFEIEIEGVQQPYEIDRAHPLVRSFEKAMRSRGVRPKVTGSEGATVISFFQAAGIPSVATGFGTTGCCHVADEYVEAENLWKGAGVLEEFLKVFSFGEDADG
jgi:succinyl-diaminopimelate desuccinylase